MFEIAGGIVLAIVLLAVLNLILATLLMTFRVGASLALLFAPPLLVLWLLNTAGFSETVQVAGLGLGMIASFVWWVEAT